jgi:hypothetical protein
MEQIMIVIAAATGEFGRLVVDQLLNRVPASDVAVAVRDVPKAADLADWGVQIRYGDYDEPDNLRDSDGARPAAVYLRSQLTFDELAQVLSEIWAGRSSIGRSMRMRAS